MGPEGRMQITPGWVLAAEQKQKMRNFGTVSFLAFLMVIFKKSVVTQYVCTSAEYIYPKSEAMNHLPG